MKNIKKILLVGILSSTIQATPIVRFFELRTEPTEKINFENVGIENLTTSIKNERGTLAMYTTHKKDDNNLNYVVEIYENETAYQVHANSPQFKKFVEVARTAVVGRKVLETNSQFLGEKKSPLYIEKSEKEFVNLVELTVNSENNSDFKKIVVNGMKQALRKENGVLLMYAVTLKDESNKWLFFEIYQDKKAYLKHRKTKHFKNYINSTKNMVIEKNIIELKGNTLVNKGGLFLEF